MATELEILFDITMMLIVASICTLVLNRLKMPTILGYLLAGLLLGPYIFPQYVMNQEIVDIFSSMGIILLMFFIGIELNLGGLKKVASTSLLVAVGEMSLMILIGYSLGLVFGLNDAQSLILGVIMSAASTAAVLMVMNSSRHLSSDEMRIITGILIMEDLGVVMVLTAAGPLMEGGSGAVLTSFFEIMVATVVFISLSILLGIAVIPKLLDKIRNHYPDEMLLLISLALAFAMAMISNAIGLSTAVGAFIMGIIVSESACSATVCNRVEPMKELFVATFFISIGFQFDPGLFLDGALFAIVIAVVFILGKLVGVSTSCYLANISTRSCLYIATSLVAMGEFSFIIAKLAFDEAIIDQAIYSSVIGAAMITLLVMPFVSRGAPRMYNGLLGRLPERVRQDVKGTEGSSTIRSRVTVPEHFRRDLRRELVYMFVDVVLIIAVLVAVNFLAILEGPLGDLGQGVGELSSFIAFFIGLVLCLPLIFILVVRFKKFSAILAYAFFIDNYGPARRHGVAGRVFKDVGEAFLALILFLLFIPFLPHTEGMGLVALAMLSVLALFITYLLWDAYKSAYRKVSSSLVKGVSRTEQRMEEKDK